MIWRNRRSLSLTALFFGSGVSGLGYQMIWVRQFGFGLGHELPAVLATIGAYMCGMGLGSWLLDRPVSGSSRPDRWFAGLEFAIGLWAIVSTLLIPAMNARVMEWVGLDPKPWWQWLLCFAMPFAVLLPATAAMGATVPAAERWLARNLRGRCVGAVYAANTLGAVSGILFSVFFLLPAFGFTRSMYALATLNLLCAGVAILMQAGPGPAPETPPQKQPAISRPRVLVCTLFTGLLGLGYEVLGVRILAQVLENTTYTFAVVLATFLFCTAIGAAVYQALQHRFRTAQQVTTLFACLGAASLLGVIGMGVGTQTYQAVLGMLLNARWGVFFGELIVAFAGFGLPTLGMGFALAFLLQTARKPGGGVGQVLALNTLGAAIAPILFGVVIIPALGFKWTACLIGLGYLALVPALKGSQWAWIAVYGVLGWLVPRGDYWVEVPGNHVRVAEFLTGVQATVTVLAEADGNRTLRVNNRQQMGGTAAAKLEYRQAHIPLLLHPQPRRLLALGTGTGITLAAATLHPDLRSDGVELLAEVVEVMPQFAPENLNVAQNENTRMFVADARRFVRAARGTYDVIIADLFHPAQDGAGALYTREHFSAVRERLSSGGLFCQWLPLYQLEPSTLRSIVRTFAEVFPFCSGWLLQFTTESPVLGLVGCMEPLLARSNWLEGRPMSADLAKHLRELSLSEPVQLFGLFVADAEALRAYADKAPLNTDDHPQVLFSAPAAGWLNPKTRDMLGPWLQPVRASELARADEVFGARLEKYWAARNVYLKGRLADAEGRVDEAHQAFLESAKLSDDFTFGYAHCLALAAGWARTKPEAARALLEQLVAAQPARQPAKEMLRRLVQ